MEYAKEDKKKTLISILFLFFVGAFIGWVYEVLLHLFTDGNFVNRGVLHGPWLPIYGVGCLLLVGLKRIVGKYPIKYFMMSMLACGILEYLTSWGLEIIYNTRWWDYSDYMFNLNGRIFLGGLIIFGMAGFLFIFKLLPILERLYSRISTKRCYLLAILLSLVFTIDTLFSLVVPNVGVGITC